MLTETQIAALERRLLEERELAARTVREMSRDIENNAMSDGDLSKVPSHLADQGSDVQEEEIDVQIAERHSERLALIDDALTRLREAPDAFDVSVVSGMTIPFERLEMVPWTRVLASEAEPAAGGGVAEEGEASSRRPGQERGAERS